VCPAVDRILLSSHRQLGAATNLTPRFLGGSQAIVGTHMDAWRPWVCTLHFTSPSYSYFTLLRRTATQHIIAFTIAFLDNGFTQRIIAPGSAFYGVPGGERVPTLDIAPHESFLDSIQGEIGIG
jgi:hypothetical protein